MWQGNPSSQSNPPQPALYSWSEVWTAVLTRPSISTFVELMRDPAASMRRAYLWLYLTGCAAALALFYILMSDPSLAERLPAEVSSNDLSSMLLSTALCVVPLAGALSVGGSMLLTAGIHFLAERLGPYASKPGRYQALFYVLAAILSPLSVINLGLLLVSFSVPSELLGGILSILSLLLWFYQMVLMGLGVQAVYGLTVSKAAAAVAVPILLAFLLIRLSGF